jgi:hypothetical protein
MTRQLAIAGITGRTPAVVPGQKPHRRKYSVPYHTITSKSREKNPTILNQPRRHKNHNKIPRYRILHRKLSPCRIRQLTAEGAVAISGRDMHYNLANLTNRLSMTLCYHNETAFPVSWKTDAVPKKEYDLFNPAKIRERYLSHAA